MRKIILFFDNIIPQKTNDKSYTVITPLLNEKNIAIAAAKNNDGTVLEKIIFKEKIEEKLLQTMSGEVKNIVALSKNDFIVEEKIADTNSHLLYVDEELKTDLETLTGNSIKNVKRAFEHPNDTNTWLLLIDGKLWEVKENGQKQMEIAKIDDNVEDFIVDEKRFLTVQQVAGKTHLFEKSLSDTKKIPRSIMALANQISWKIMDIDDEKIYLIDQENKLISIAYAAKEANETILANNIISGVWNKERTMLLWWNNFELWVFDPKEEKSTLITRQSAPLKDVHWYTADSHIMFSDTLGIHVIETDTRDAALSNTLFKSSEVTKFFTTDKEKDLWIQENNQLLFAIVR